MFKTYSAWNWLLIDAATNYGNDKMLFEERIQWTMDHFDELEAIADKAETPALYMKAVMAIRKAQKGLPSGHLVGVDATCSGIQIMSCLTGCETGAYNTGLINDNMRADAYTKGTDLMNEMLEDMEPISRKHAKNAIMTAYYGSYEQPVLTFGEGTPALEAFYEAMQQLAPGPYELLQDLKASWQPYALQHAWTLPDGFDARVKVLTHITAKDSRSRVEVDELDHATFTYEYYINEGQKKGVSNVANVVHSVDGWVLRSMHRRCNYDPAIACTVAGLIASELYNRSQGTNSDQCMVDEETFNAITKYKNHYERSTIVDIVILPWLTSQSVRMLDTKHLEKLGSIIAGMMQYNPFPIITIHDEFKSHPNNVNWMRWQYKEILADIADSNMLVGIMDEIHGTTGGSYKKLSHDLGDKIRDSSYALC